MSTGSNVKTFDPVFFLCKKSPAPVAAWSSGTGAGIVISMVFLWFTYYSSVCGCAAALRALISACCWLITDS